MAASGTGPGRLHPFAARAREGSAFSESGAAGVRTPQENVGDICNIGRILDGTFAMESPWTTNECKVLKP